MFWSGHNHLAGYARPLDKNILFLMDRYCGNPVDKVGNRERERHGANIRRIRGALFGQKALLLPALPRARN